MSVSLKTLLVLVASLSCHGMTENWPVLIHNSGIRPLGTKDVSIVFYVTVENKGVGTLTTGLEMERCCQTISMNDIDCESMILHSGLRVELTPNHVRNLTMYFNNMYLHPRSGYCWLKLRWKGSGNVIKQKFIEGEKFKIEFDTRLPKPNFIQDVVDRDPDKYSLCPSVDQDPKNYCLRVNCLIKYNGFRSFFNESVKRCQPTPQCFDPSTFSVGMELKPAVILSPLSNKCKNIKSGTQLTEDMKGLVDIMPEAGVLSFRTYPVKLKCINGVKVMSSEAPPSCACESGWTSSDFPAKTFNPALDTYTMCDRLTPNGEHQNKARAASVNFIVLIVIIVILSLVICFLLPFYLRKYWRRRKYNRLSSELASPSSGSDSGLISEIKDRREVIVSPVHSIHTREVYGNVLINKPPPLIFGSRIYQRERQPVDRAEKCIKAEAPCPCKPMYLRFPEKITRTPESPVCTCSTPSSECDCRPEPAYHPIPAMASWSVPSANGNRCGKCILEKTRFAGPCASVEAFPRRVETCCCENFSGNHAGLSQVIQLKALRPDAPSDFCDTTFDAHSSRYIENAARKLQQELVEDVTGTWSPQTINSLSRSSSTLTTLTEFWREDKCKCSPQDQKSQDRDRDRVTKQFWVDPFIHSLKR